MLHVLHNKYCTNMFVQNVFGYFLGPRFRLDCKYLVLSTTKRYSFYFRREEKKPKRLHI